VECEVSGCQRPSRANKMCTLHNSRMKRNGHSGPGPRALGSPEFRFWRKVDQNGANGCWNWTGGTHKKGYGTLQGGDGTNRNIATHRFSYELHKGPIPAGMYVMHICDNPRCVNPDHLKLGTATDNVRDMWEKGRAKPTGVKGEGHKKAKLTEDDVRMLRADTTKNNHEWARHFGVSANAIRHARIGRNWSHI
jgi:DNA-binding transcriptional regulator YiaG